MKITYIDGKKNVEPTITDEGIYGFFDTYRFLSNFHPCSITMSDGLTYPSTENAYQAFKTLDIELRKPFTTYRAGESKVAGQLLKLRGDWEKIKDGVMLEALSRKFEDPELKQKLLATGDKVLEETNNWSDRYWGVVDGVGKNMLGKLLMGIRATSK